ncbi:hypothetical protein DFH09DRAFT_1398145 [Mycena vulgaris]|nr:hypothetical protein DFH09DRAFT_1398145 [Mycena vulgaris]
MSLRSRKHYSVNLLVGGYDTAEHAPHLYGIQIDYFGTMAEVPSPLAPPATARTLCSVYSTVARAYSLPRELMRCTRYHGPEAPLEEGLAPVKRCIDEVSKRLVASPGKYEVEIGDKDGVSEVEL